MAVREIGIGGCHQNKEEVYQHAWDKGVRLFDDGWGYSGNLVNTNFLGKFLEDKKREDYKIIEKLPLFDQLYLETFGFHLDDATDEQLKLGIKTCIEKQLELTKVGYFDYYLLHAIYDDKYTNNPRLGDINLYKRIVKILLDYKKKGIIRHIGFSAHVDFKTLYYFVTEMKKEFGDDFDTAMVSYNVLNSDGCSQTEKGFFQTFYNITVWDAPGFEGLKFLKENGFYVINMMPTESGRLGAACSSPDWYDWNYRFIRDTKEIDVTLIGTSHIEHFDQFYKQYVEKGELKDVPDMRVINTGKPAHCGE